MKKCLVVLSGGMDSTTAVYLARKEYEDVSAVGFDYGQRHMKELVMATSHMHNIGVPFNVLVMPNWAEGASALTHGGEVPEGHYAHPTMKQTVVPNRNSIMLNVAVGYAMSRGIDVVYTGVHAGDHPVYPDCRPVFLAQLNHLINIANEGFAHPIVSAPFMHEDKAYIARIGERLEVPWERTWSCYKGGEIHCGRCSTCIERIEALHEARIDDPTEYADIEYWKEVVDA